MRRTRLPTKEKLTTPIVLNGIIAAGMERVAAQETVDSKEKAPASSINGDGLVGELRTCGGETARMPEQRRDAKLICSNQSEQHLFNHTPSIVRRTGASSSRIS
jgi:hypothetical protein